MINDKNDRLTVNPLSLNIYRQILQTDLCIFPWKLSWKNLVKNQSIFS